MRSKIERSETASADPGAHLPARASLAAVPLARTIEPTNGASIYDVIRAIGTGSFGRAILARKRDEGRLYVIKKIDTSTLRRRERKAAVNEVRLLSSVNHPFIIRYKSWFFDRLDGHLCIAMEFADGGDLYRAILQQRRRKQYFSEKQILRWFTQATLALKYLHENHILHRDLKTQNLFLTASGKIKLGDFGIAKALDATTAFTETQIGTPFYLSPEICKNKPYSWSSDIWSLGCILYETATLQTPFNAPNLTVLVEKITKRPPPMLPQTFSNDLRKLCADCLARDPEKRPSAADLLMRDVLQQEIAAMVEEVRLRRFGSSSTDDLARGVMVSTDDKVGATYYNTPAVSSSMPGCGKYNDRHADSARFVNFRSDPHPRTPVPTCEKLADAPSGGVAQYEPYVTPLKQEKYASQKSTQSTQDPQNCENWSGRRYATPSMSRCVEPLVTPSKDGTMAQRHPLRMQSASISSSGLRGTAVLRTLRNTRPGHGLPRTTSASCQGALKSPGDPPTVKSLSMRVRNSSESVFGESVARVTLRNCLNSLPSEDSMNRTSTTSKNLSWTPPSHVKTRNARYEASQQRKATMEDKEHNKHRKMGFFWFRRRWLKRKSKISST